MSGGPRLEQTHLLSAEARRSLHLRRWSRAFIVDSATLGQIPSFYPIICTPTSPYMTGSHSPTLAVGRDAK